MMTLHAAAVLLPCMLFAPMDNQTTVLDMVCNLTYLMKMFPVGGPDAASDGCKSIANGAGAAAAGGSDGKDSDDGGESSTDWVDALDVVVDAIASDDGNDLTPPHRIRRRSSNPDECVFPNATGKGKGKGKRRKGRGRGGGRF